MRSEIVITVYRVHTEARRSFFLLLFLRLSEIVQYRRARDDIIGVKSVKLYTKQEFVYQTRAARVDRRRTLRLTQSTFVLL